MSAETMWVFLGATGREADDGIVAEILPFVGTTMLVTIYARRLPEYERLAQRIADQTGHAIELVRFTRAEVVKMIRPRPQG